MHNASARYDFVLRFAAPPCQVPEQSDDMTCEGPGVVEVRRKGESSPLQVLALDNIFASFPDGQLPWVNSARRYEYQGVINVGDFNFDGQ